MCERYSWEPYHDFDRSGDALDPGVTSFNRSENLRDIVTLDHSDPLTEVVVRHEVFLLAFHTVDQDRTSLFLNPVLVVVVNRLATPSVVD